MIPLSTTSLATVLVYQSIDLMSLNWMLIFEYLAYESVIEDDNSIINIIKMFNTLFNLFT